MTSELPPNLIDRPDIHPWEHGHQVLELQTLLRAHGFELRLDGDFGSRTEAAVRRFQHRQGLRVDGVVGKLTWTALIEQIQPGTRPLKSGCVGADVWELQGLLLIHGFEICRNHIYDAETETAVRQFQLQSKLRETGIVDDATWTFLRGRGIATVTKKENCWLPNSRKWW